MVFNAFRSEIFSMPSKKIPKESDNSDQSFLSGCYGRAVKSVTLVEILLEDAQPIRRIQGRKIKMLTWK